MSNRLLALSGLILAAAFSRFLPHPANWTAVGAVALLAGSRFPKAWQGILVPLAAMILTDALIGFHRHLGYVYGALALTAICAHLFRDRIHGWRVGVAAIAGSVAFFLITNFGVWAMGGMYAASIDGLLASYVAGLPYLANQVFGDLFYAAILFAAWDRVLSREPARAKV